MSYCRHRGNTEGVPSRCQSKYAVARPPRTTGFPSSARPPTRAARDRAARTNTNQLCPTVRGGHHDHAAFVGCDSLVAGARRVRQSSAAGRSRADPRIHRYGRYAAGRRVPAAGRYASRAGRISFADRSGRCAGRPRVARRSRRPLAGPSVLHLARRPDRPRTGRCGHPRGRSRRARARAARRSRHQRGRPQAARDQRASEHRDPAVQSGGHAPVQEARHGIRVLARQPAHAQQGDDRGQPGGDRRRPQYRRRVLRRVVDAGIRRSRRRRSRPGREGHLDRIRHVLEFAVRVSGRYAGRPRCGARRARPRARTAARLPAGHGGQSVRAGSPAAARPDRPWAGHGAVVGGMRRCCTTIRRRSRTRQRTATGI